MTERNPTFLTRREFTDVAVGGLAALLLPPSSARAAEDASPDVRVLRDVMVPMRDGVRLATDIYLPARNGNAAAQRFPAILERTPYDKTADSRSERTPTDAKPKSRAEVAAFFVRNGYVVIYQDCRGRYKSEGEFVKYLADGHDGYDTCAWIIRQAWSNGSIGTMGLSYAAHTQGALGSAGAPGVKAMFLDSGGFANAYQGGIRQGGAFEMKQATWAFSEALASPRVRENAKALAALQSVDIAHWFQRLPWHRGDSPLSAAPEYESYLFDQWEHGRFDAYWKQLGIYAEGFYDQYCDAAMVHMSSWYDPYPRTATQNYMALSRRKHGPVRLILGPWTHGDRQLTYAGDVDFGAAATIDGNVAADFLTLRLRWFDRWLKGSANGVELLVTPLNPPHVVRGDDGRDHLEYDLLVTNAFASPVTLTAVEVSGPGRAVLGRVVGATLAAATQGVLEQPPVAAIRASGAATVEVDLALPPGRVPPPLSHRIAYAVPDASPHLVAIIGSREVPGPELAVSPLHAVAIQPPLRGAGWAAFTAAARRTPTATSE